MEKVKEGMNVDFSESGVFTVTESFVSKLDAKEFANIEARWKAQKMQLEREYQEMNRLFELKLIIENSKSMSYVFEKLGVMIPNEDMLGIKREQLSKLNKRLEQIKPYMELARKELEKPIKIESKEAEEKEVDTEKEASENDKQGI